MNKTLLPLGVVCLLAPAMQGALVNYDTRSAWEAAVSLPSFLTNVNNVNGQNWIDFSSNTYCPTNNCPTSGNFNTYTSSGPANPAIMTLNSGGQMTGLSFAGYSSLTGSSPGRLFVYDKDWTSGISTPAVNWQIAGNDVNWLSSRGTQQSATGKLRINLPAGALGVAMEIALGCYISTGCTNGENLPGMIALTTSNGETKTLGDTNSTKAFTNGSSTVGEFTFFGFTTDQTQIAWIDLTPDSPGAVVLARFTYVTALAEPPPPEAVPEPSTWLLLTAATLLLVTGRFRQRL